MLPVSPVSSTSQLRWAWSFVHPYRSRFIALTALSLLEIVLRMTAPFAMLVVVDHALGTTPVSHTLGSALDSLGLSSERDDLLVTFSLTGLTLQLLHQLVVMWHGRIGVRVGQNMIRDVREQLFSRMQAWAIERHGAMPTGDAVQRLEADSRSVEQIVLRGLFPIAFSVLTLVVMFGVLLTIDPGLALVALTVLPPLYLWLRCYARRMAPCADHARHTDSRLSSRLIETLTAIRLIKSHAREDHERSRFSAVAHDNARAWIGVGHQGTLLSIVTGSLTIAGSTLVLLVGGLAVLDGRITLGTLLLVLAYLGYVYGPLSAVANLTGSLHQAFASARRARAAFDVLTEIEDRPGEIDASTIRGEVRFEHVSFGYGDGRKVLDDVSFVARPGEMIALVGPSGAGKSTLVTLLLRFYDAAAGRITIDGVPIDAYGLRSLRQHVAIVLQEALVTSGTVADNLRYGRLDANDVDVERAARAANAHDFIKHLPHGYATELGEAGSRLSGGQRQRISIARAFLKNAPILILDEPTAALDTIAELQVVEAIRRLWAHRTTFVVAHRLSTVRDADRILVMDQGRIVAEGTHDRLLETSELYRKLAAQLMTTSRPSEHVASLADFELRGDRDGRDHAPSDALAL